jgi:hypothetical protein
MHLMQIKNKHSSKNKNFVRTKTSDLCHHILLLYHCTTHASNEK